MNAIDERRSLGFEALIRGHIGGDHEFLDQAMGVEADIARATIRLSLGRFTTGEEVERAVELILEAAKR